MLSIIKTKEGARRKERRGVRSDEEEGATKKKERRGGRNDEEEGARKRKLPSLKETLNCLSVSR